jgi:hypothetical protein
VAFPESLEKLSGTQSYFLGVTMHTKFCVPQFPLALKVYGSTCKCCMTFNFASLDLQIVQPRASG